MANGNGSKWTLWLAGTIVTALTTAMFTLGNAVVLNDKDSRYRDEKAQECLNENVIEQKQINQEILIALKEIQVDLKYIKKEATCPTR